MSGVRRAYADVDGRQLHYRTAGETGRPVLLMLHQTPSTSAMYQPLMQRLADRFYLLAPDTPGFGGSDPLPGTCSIAAFADTLSHWLDGLGIERCFALGHHTGAAIAVQLAFARPDLCRALALSGPTLLSPEQQQDLPQLASPFPVAEDGAHLLQMWQRIRAKDERAPLAIVQREVLSAIAAGDAYQASYRAVCEQDFGGQLPQLACPVLVFAGDDDALYAAVQPSLALLRDGRGAELPPGSGTYACERQVETMTEILSAFYADVSEDGEQ